LPGTAHALQQPLSYESGCSSRARQLGTAARLRRLGVETPSFSTVSAHGFSTKDIK
jgi:hypothetical protein